MAILCETVARGRPGGRCCASLSADLKDLKDKCELDIKEETDQIEKLGERLLKMDVRKKALE